MANPAANAVMGSAGEVVVDSAALAFMTQWTFTPTSSESAWGDSDSAGYTHRKAARKDGTGSAECKLDSTAEAYDVLDVGDDPELVLWINSTLYYDLPCAIITRFSLSVNQDSKEVIGCSADFGASGIFYKPGQSGAPVKTYPT